MNGIKILAIILSISIVGAVIFTNIIFPRRRLDKATLNYRIVSMKNIPREEIYMLALPKDFDYSNVNDFNHLSKYVSRIVFLDEYVGIAIGFPFKIENIKVGEAFKVNKTIIIEVTYGSGLPGLIYLGKIDEECTFLISIKNETGITVLSAGSVRDRSKCIEVYGKVIDENNRLISNIPIKLYAVMHVNITEIKLNVSKFLPFISDKNLTSILISDRSGKFSARIFSPAYASDTVFLIYLNNSTDGYYVIPNTRNTIYNITLVFRGG